MPDFSLFCSSMFSLMKTQISLFNLSSTMQMENMVFFLAELGLMQYPTIILYPPSLIAASAVYAARCTLEKSPFWSETLKHHTGYSEDQLRLTFFLLFSL